MTFTIHISQAGDQWIGIVFASGVPSGVAEYRVADSDVAKVLSSIAFGVADMIDKKAVIIPAYGTLQRLGD